MNWTVKDAEGYGAIIGIDWETAEFSPEALLKGMMIELEHKRLTGGDPLASAEIALDHLTESSRYYEFLEEVEEKFKKKAVMPAPKLQVTWLPMETDTEFVGETDENEMFIGDPEEVEIQTMEGYESAAPSFDEAFFNIHVYQDAYADMAWTFWFTDLEGEETFDASKHWRTVKEVQRAATKAINSYFSKLSRKEQQAILAPPKPKPKQKRKPKRESLDALANQYPRLFKELATADQWEDSMFGMEELQRSKNPRLLLDKFAVYDVMTRAGPDIDANLLGRYLPKIRKDVGGDILRAWEDGSLYRYLESAGWFGPASDVLRGPMDRYYSYRGAKTMRRRRRFARGKLSIWSQHVVTVGPVDKTTAAIVKEDGYEYNAVSVDIKGAMPNEYEVITTFDDHRDSDEFENHLRFELK